MYGKYECFVMQMLYVCVHPVAVLNAAFCMTCSLLMLVEDVRRVSLQLLRGGIWACIGALVYVIVGLWDGDYISQLPYLWYYVGVKNSFQHDREECESKRCYVI